VLTYINNGAGYDVYWRGVVVMPIGQVGKLGSKWQARFPDGSYHPILYSTRRSAGERLRRMAERRAT